MTAATASRLDEAIRAIDAANADDPRRAPPPHGDRPFEVVYAERMTAWLDRLAPDASEALRLAVRAQHIRRWEIPRDSFPRNRNGYLKWRTTLYAFHADRAAEILRAVGYDEATIDRVRSLLRKERLKTDAEAQTLEDCACLVFLENHFAEFASQHDAEKIVGIVRKTWRKMSDRARAEAAGLLPALPPDARALVEKALA